ncbi:MAG: hypothetical protein ACLFR1_11865, partial [Spirochaetia bacterium]
MKKITTYIAIFYLLLSSCTISLKPELTPPGNLAASTDLDDRIEVTWDAVPGVQAYIVYRASAQEGPWEEPFTTVNTNQFTDIDVTPGNYSYRVASADVFDTSIHSDQSEFVTGMVVGTPVNPEWSGTQTLQAGAAEVMTAVDFSNGDVYIGAVSEGTDSKLRVWRRTLEQGTWEEIDPAPGLVPGEIGRAAIAASGGTLFAATSEISEENSLRVRSFDTQSETWQRMTASGISAAEITEPSIAVSPADNSLIAVAVQEDSVQEDSVQEASDVTLYRYNAETQSWNSSTSLTSSSDPQAVITG